LNIVSGPWLESLTIAKARAPLATPLGRLLVGRVSLRG
jgi:hypothetical protein